jgi:hypothetical protein
MKKASITIIQVVLTLLITSCTEQPQTAREMEKVINKSLNIALFDSISSGQGQISYYDFRKQFNFVSVVFLQEGCAPCYPKFLEWHNKMDPVIAPDNYTTLFIINAKDYKQFIEGAMGYEQIDDRYYHVIDPENRFLRNNSEIPPWIIDRALLIDQENKIKLIGAPYATGDMTKVFHIITGVKQ